MIKLNCKEKFLKFKMSQRINNKGVSNWNKRMNLCWKKMNNLSLDFNFFFYFKKKNNLKF